MARHDDYPARVEFTYQGSAQRKLMTARPLLALAAFAISLPLFALHLIVWLIAGIALVFGSYPSLLWRYQKWFAVFYTRMLAFSSSLIDTFPFRADPTMRIALDDPVPSELDRRLALLKPLLALPHLLIVDLALAIGVLFDFATWLAIISRGAHPRWLFDYGAGIARWNLRALAYATLLCTDRYPPFDPRP